MTTVLPKDFNWKVYIELHKDLKNKNEEQAIFHYLNHGIKEKRSYKIEKNTLPFDFDWKTYLHLNKDLGEKNEAEAVSHFLKHGKIENRRYKKDPLPPNFDWNIYLKIHSDLLTFFEENVFMDCLKKINLKISDSSKIPLYMNNAKFRTFYNQCAEQYAIDQYETIGCVEKRQLEIYLPKDFYF